MVVGDMFEADLPYNTSRQARFYAIVLEVGLLEQQLDIIARFACPEHEQIVDGLLPSGYLGHLGRSLVVLGVLNDIDRFDIPGHDIMEADVVAILAFLHMRTGAICVVDTQVSVLHEGLMGEVDWYSGFDHRSEV